MEVWAEKAVAFAQRRPKLAALLLGLVSALGYPPLHAWPIAILGVAGLVWHVHAASDWRAALARGYLFGWAHLTLANNWIATAFTHQAKMPEFLGWLAVPLLCVYLAVYPTLAALAAHLLARRSGLFGFGVVLAGAWIVMEWLRGWAFTGYPWPPLGLMLLGGWSTPGVAALLPWLGTYALSGVAVLFGLAIALGLSRRNWSLLGVTLVVLAAGMLAPWNRLSPNRDTTIRYTLVQPNITQDEINDPAKFEEQFARLARLTLPERGRPRVVLWPESALPDYLEDGYPQRHYDRFTARNPETGRGDPEFARQRIATVIGPEATLLSGVVNLDFAQQGNVRYVESARNSVIALNDEGEIFGQYAKAHLVPYGEYLPMRSLLEPLGFSRLVAGSIDYREGPGPQSLDLGRLGKVGVQICYEIVFSGEVIDRNNRPDYIFNPSNDGWFGLWGSPQFVGQSRMRAIEEGLPVLRSTTTGISAVIDPRGIVRQSIPSGEAESVVGNIPVALSPTVFARLGNALPLGWAILLIIAGVAVPRMLARRDARG